MNKEKSDFICKQFSKTQINTMKDAVAFLAKYGVTNEFQGGYYESEDDNLLFFVTEEELGYATLRTITSKILPYKIKEMRELFDMIYFEI